MAPPSLLKPWGRPPANEPPRGARVFGLPPAAVFLSPAPVPVGVARRSEREPLSEWGTSPETCDDALLTSELVTDALPHTASEWIVGRPRTARQRLHIEAEDQNRGPTLPARRRPGPDDQGGRGLVLSGMVSRGWGVTDAALGSGRTVSAVLPSQPSAMPREATATGPAPTRHLTRALPHSAEGPPPHGTTARS